MNLTQYIKQQIFESGNAIQNASRIPPKTAILIYCEIEDKLLSKYKKLEVTPLGSIGKKRPDQTHGDIDIAVVCKSKKELVEMIHSVFDGDEKVTEINDNTTPSIISIGYKFDTNKIAQVDFMFAEDLEYAMFFFDSPDFTKDESAYKGGLRGMLLSTIISNIPVEDGEIEYFDNGQIKSKWKHTLNASGIFKQFLSWAGSKGPLKNPRKQKELEQFVSRNPNEIMRFIFGDNAKPDLFRSAESLWNAIHNSKLFPFKKEVVQDIEDDTFKYFDNNGIDKNEFLKNVKLRGKV